MLVLLLVATPLGQLVASAGANQLHQEFELEGLQAARITLNLPSPARVTYATAWKGPLTVLDVAGFSAIRSLPSGDLWSWGCLLGSAWNGAEMDGHVIGVDVNAVTEHVGASALGFRAHVDLVEDDPWWQSSAGLDMPAGLWTIVLVRGFSQAVDRTRFEFDVDAPDATATWQFTDRTALVTARDLDDAGIHGQASVLGFGPSAAVGASRTVHLERGPVGLTRYLDGIGDLHDYRIEGPQGPLQAEDQILFEGTPAGDYNLHLNQVSAGTPERMFFLYADLG